MSGSESDPHSALALQEQEEIGTDPNEYSDENKDKIVEYSPKNTFIRFNELLGSGAYKEVYKGYDQNSGCEIAWNVIKLQNQSPSDRNRISKEITLLQNLKHKNVIHFINAWINRNKDEVVFITECLSGGSLKKYLNRIKKPRLKIIKMWSKQILTGLEYLHSQTPHPIIHRDLKCENIFVNTESNEIRIGDFGLARKLETSHTKSVLGTPEFMAPEIFEENYGTAVDIYAFGMCLLEMATLQIPYSECTSVGQVYKKVISGRLPESMDLLMNQPLKDFILKCIQNKTSRPSATQLLEDPFFEETEDDKNSILLSTDKPQPQTNVTQQQQQQAKIVSQIQESKSQQTQQTIVNQQLDQQDLQQQQQQQQVQQQNITNLEKNMSAESPRKQILQTKFHQANHLQEQQSSENSSMLPQEYIRDYHHQAQQLKRNSQETIKSPIKLERLNRKQSPQKQKSLISKQNSSPNQEESDKDQNKTSEFESFTQIQQTPTPFIQNSNENMNSDQQEEVKELDNNNTRFDSPSIHVNDLVIAQSSSSNHKFDEQHPSQSTETIPHTNPTIGIYSEHNIQTPITSKQNLEILNDTPQQSQEQLSNVSLETGGILQDEFISPPPLSLTTSIVSSATTAQDPQNYLQQQQQFQTHIQYESADDNKQGNISQLNAYNIKSETTGNHEVNEGQFEEKVENAEDIQAAAAAAALEVPYSIEVIDEKELKNSKYQVRFSFSIGDYMDYFEIDNSKEDFSEEMIFAFALAKAKEFAIIDYVEQFQFDLYNLVSDKYNSYHSLVSLGHNFVKSEAIANTTNTTGSDHHSNSSHTPSSVSTPITVFSSHPHTIYSNATPIAAAATTALQSTGINQMLSPTNNSSSTPQANEATSILEIFIRHYENYMKEIEDYLANEGPLNQQVRQHKEQIQLNRFHLNQKEMQIDSASRAQQQQQMIHLQFQQQQSQQQQQQQQQPQQHSGFKHSPSATKSQPLQQLQQPQSQQAYYQPYYGQQPPMSTHTTVSSPQPLEITSHFDVQAQDNQQYMQISNNVSTSQVYINSSLGIVPSANTLNNSNTNCQSSKHLQSQQQPNPRNNSPKSSLQMIEDIQSNSSLDNHPSTPYRINSLSTVNPQQYSQLQSTHQLLNMHPTSAGNQIPIAATAYSHIHSIQQHQNNVSQQVFWNDLRVNTNPTTNANLNSKYTEFQAIPQPPMQPSISPSTSPNLLHPISTRTARLANDLYNRPETLITSSPKPFIQKLNYQSEDSLPNLAQQQLHLQQQQVYIQQQMQVNSVTETSNFNQQNVHRIPPAKAQHSSQSSPSHDILPSLQLNKIKSTEYHNNHLVHIHPYTEDPLEFNDQHQQSRNQLNHQQLQTQNSFEDQNATQQFTFRQNFTPEPQISENNQSKYSPNLQNSYTQQPIYQLQQPKPIHQSIQTFAQKNAQYYSPKLSYTSHESNNLHSTGLIPSSLSPPVEPTQIQSQPLNQTTKHQSLAASTGGTNRIQQSQKELNSNHSVNQQQLSQSKGSPRKSSDEIRKLIQDIKVFVMKEQPFKLERTNHEKSRDEGEIRLLQRSLCILLPSQLILENGQFGNYTELMIKTYQKQHGIATVNGAIDNELWRSITCELEARLAERQSQLFSHQQQKQGLNSKQQQTQQQFSPPQGQQSQPTTSQAKTKEQQRKQMMKDIQSQQSRETLSNFESKIFSDFNLTNDSD